METTSRLLAHRRFTRDSGSIQPSAQRGHASDVEALFALWVSASNQQIVNLRFCQIRVRRQLRC